MNKFFINSNNYHKLIIISFCILFLLPFKIFIFWILLSAVVLYLFKKNKVLVKDALTNSIDIVVSPVTGIIKAIEIEKDHVKYLIASPALGNFGLYFPFSSTIDRFETHGGDKIQRLGRNSKITQDADRVELSFVNRTGSRVGINIYRSLISGKPHVWPKVGDKGRVSSNFGFLPFGGIVEVSVWGESNQLVSSGEKVLSGSTPLAGFKGNNDER
jgi:hypothetical protein